MTIYSVINEKNMPLGFFNRRQDAEALLNAYKRLYECYEHKSVQVKEFQDENDYLKEMESHHV